MSVIDQPPKPPGFGARLLKATQYLISGIGGNSFFSPGQPVRPMGPGSDPGRRYDYRTGINTSYIPRSDEDFSTSFYELRALAENHDITRLLIETRKDQVEALKWVIRPIQSELDRKKKKLPTPDSQKRAEQCTDFFRKPDGINPFGTWLRLLTEDLLVIDAPTIYINRESFDTRFEVFDGATIKRFVDIRGNPPAVPDPAYQQIIKGTPAWDFTSDEIVYMPRNPRPNKLYGYSPVQQIMLTINTALRRNISQLEYYTEGNVPDALAQTPKEWTPDQIIAYQKAFDDMNSSTAERRKMKFIPGGGKVDFTREVHLKDEFDEWLARVACYAFSISPQAFVKQMNRATADTAKEAAAEEGLEPLMRWIVQLINHLLQHVLGQYDLEFTWEESVDQDPAVQSEIVDRNLKNGKICINEAREADGLDPIEGGDVHMIYTGTGPIPVSIAAKGPQIPPALGGTENPDEGDDGLPPGKGPGGGSTPAQKPPKPGMSGSKKPPAKEAEAETKPNAKGGEKNGPSVKPKKAAATTQRVDANIRGGAAVHSHIHKSRTIDTPKTLYIRRQVLNPQDIIAWAKTQGFTKTLAASDFHVTQMFSRKLVKWSNIPVYSHELTAYEDDREVAPLGDKGAVVLKFEHDELSKRWRDLCAQGCSWDYPEYTPHVTISYDSPDMDLSDVAPYGGKIILGPELFEEVVEDWDSTIKEQTVKAAPSQALQLSVHGKNPSAIVSVINDNIDDIRRLLKTIRKNDGTPKVGDFITIDSDAGAIDNAPWTGEVLEADGWRVKVDYDDGERWYNLNSDALEDYQAFRQTSGGGHWYFTKGVAKSGKVPFARSQLTKAGKKYRTLNPIPRENKVTRKAEKDIEDGVAKLLARVGKDVAKQYGVFAATLKVQKADDEEDDLAGDPRLDFVTVVDLSDLDNITEEVVSPLDETSKSATMASLAQMGVKDRGELVDQVNERSEEYAYSRAAELVGKRWDADTDSYIDNPDADWSIDETTRDMLRATIYGSMQDGKAVDGIQRDIEEGFGFSRDRARMIARTEVSFAHNSGASEGYKTAASETGLHIMKEWLLGEDPCDECVDNADEGPIELDDEFPSGDDAPPAHPNCECAVSPVVADDDSGDNSSSNEDNSDE